MASELKKKTIHGFFWSFLDNIALSVIAFIVGIILARLLSPEEYGIIGMTMIFIALSSSVVESGFSQALIRKQNCTQTDYSTVFYFNIVVGLLLFLLLCLASHQVALFFAEPQLEIVLKVLAVVLIIDSFTIVHRAILTKRVDFKLQTKISVIASVSSGVLAVVMASHGYGVWSLVFYQIARRVVELVLFWCWNKWQPLLVFSIKSFRDLFSFGSKLLISGLIDTAYRNVYFLVIGKYYSAADLGHFTRAESFQKLLSENLTGVISRVSYPVLSSIQDDLPRLKYNFQKLVCCTMYIAFFSMLGMAAVAEPMIIVLIGQQWAPAIIYLQLLCFVGMLYPLHALNLNILNVFGRSDLFLRLEIIKKILAIPAICLGIFWGIKAMIVGMILASIISFYINSYWSGKLLGYSFLDQLKDLYPIFIMAFLVNTAVFILGKNLTIGYFLILIVQITFGVVLALVVSELLKLKSYIQIKNIVLEKFNK